MDENRLTDELGSFTKKFTDLQVLPPRKINPNSDANTEASFPQMLPFLKGILTVGFQMWDTEPSKIVHF